MGAALIALAAFGSAAAQAPAPAAPVAVRTVMQSSLLAANGPQQVILGQAVFPKGGVAARHRHAGVESAFVLEGQVELSIDGSPPRILRAGEGFQIPAGVPHTARALGDAGAKVLSTWVIEEGAPIAEPVP